MSDDVKMPAEWIVELLRQDMKDEWKPSPSFYSWLITNERLLGVEVVGNKYPPRTLDECMEFLSLPRDKSERIEPERAVYRVRNTRTDEVIPGDIFDV